MPDGRLPLEVHVVEAIGQLDAQAWDACAGADNPFLSHAFLAALEDSACVSGEQGWLPQHLAIYDEAGAILGCVPLYLKTHSYGEYVFDWGWADAYERAGGQYYPKLQCAVPFTPVTGPRLLIRRGAPEAEIQQALIAAMVKLAERHRVSSLHVTFPTAPEWQALGQAGFLRRTGLQYHWTNRGYETFEAFLGDLASRKRKAIRKERRAVAEAGITLRRLSGADLTAHHWDVFYDFYLSTADRKWGHPYLNRAFFERLGESLADQVVLVLAEHEGQPVAAALNLVGGQTIYGRNWGSSGRFRFLHFETCYYQAIEHAIAHGLQQVEAGAQGEHKIQRGYLPVETYSAHWIRDPALRDAVARFLDRERTAIQHEKVALAAEAPFRKDNEPIRNPD